MLLTYCRAVDRCDWDLLRTVYHPDAVINHGLYQGGVDGFVEFVQSRRTGIVHTAHYISNVIVDPVSDGLVATEAYGWAVQSFALPSALVKPGFQGVRYQSTYRYVDLMEQRDGRWAIVEGNLVLGDLDVQDLEEAPVVRAGMTQRPSMDDPLYKLRDGWAGRIRTS